MYDVAPFAAAHVRTTLKLSGSICAAKLVGVGGTVIADTSADALQPLTLQALTW
jgi:hypothetical protein